MYVQLEEGIDKKELWKIIKNFDATVITDEEKDIVRCLLNDIVVVFANSRMISKKRCLFHIIHAIDILRVRKRIE